MNTYGKVELDKILAGAAEYAVLEGGKEALIALTPTSELIEAKRRLNLTEEAWQLLFTLGAGKICYFPPLDDILIRAEKGSTLSPSEITAAACLLHAAREGYRTVHAYEGVEGMRALTENLVFNEALERDIEEKIIGEELSDKASPRLYEIRTELRLLSERIRTRLSEYLTSEKQYLQEELVTMRGDRYVLPVKVEYKRNVRGFVHDRSQSGSTVYIEPEEVLEMNNELRSLQLDEKEEEERILSLLSHSLGQMREALERDREILTELDTYYARAEYGYRLKCTKPVLNGRGILDIRKGRHPLLEQKSAVPVTVSVGENYRFLIISGANTGGKTVTLKMCGLFSLMAACGFFVPSAEGTRLSVFDGVYCDIGDSQSIEENLSTFSSHILNLKEILEQVSEKSLVLIDEPGGGTDPEEGQALAQAVLSALIKKGCRGIVTTHYTALKEYAYRENEMENGCMEFDSESLKPLYRLKIGVPGSSNALFICTRLGLPEAVIEEARSRLSEGARAFEFIVRSAEESRIRAEEQRAAAAELERKWREQLARLSADEEKFRKERERFLLNSKAEARRIVAERTLRAEEMLSEMEKLFKKEHLTEADLIRARTLKNAFSKENVEEEAPVRREPVNINTLKEGDRVFVASMAAEGVVLSKRKEGAEVQCGALRVRAKYSELYESGFAEKKKEVKVVKDLKARTGSVLECNVIGLTVAEAIPEVEAFLDGALVQNLKEVRIVHGMGTGKLRTAIQSYLKQHKRVKEFRIGRYGEGESGVTVVTLE